MSAVLPAAKENTFQPPAGLLAWLAEKPHPGLQPKEPKPHPADHTVKFQIALGFRVCSYDSCAGPLSTGYYRDASTGLDYADQRYEQPGAGRFMSPDPYGGSAKASDPGSWNRYAYVGGDPVNRTDPEGLADFSVTGTGYFYPEYFETWDPYFLFAEGSYPYLSYPYQGGDTPSLADMVQETTATMRGKARNAIEGLSDNCKKALMGPDLFQDPDSYTSDYDIGLSKYGIGS